MFRNLRVLFKSFRLIVGFIFILLSQVAAAQTFSINGTVVSKKTGQPLAAVTVVDKGNKQSVITDEKGNFQLDVPGKSVLAQGPCSIERIFSEDRKRIIT